MGRWKRGTIALSLAVGLATCMQSSAGDQADDRIRLTTVLRQLDLIERLAREGESAGFEGGGRYHFDYARLREDLTRMRVGVEDYLTPTRAQPRDPSTILGNYRREARQ